MPERVAQTAGDEDAADQEHEVGVHDPAGASHVDAQIAGDRRQDGRHGVHGPTRQQVAARDDGKNPSGQWSVVSGQRQTDSSRRIHFSGPHRAIFNRTPMTTGHGPLTTRYQSDYADRPGQVTAIRGVISKRRQEHGWPRHHSAPRGARPLDRRHLAFAREPTLAMHAGLHVVIDGEREFVAEQLVGNLYLDFPQRPQLDAAGQVPAARSGRLGPDGARDGFSSGRRRGGGANDPTPECDRGASVPGRRLHGIHRARLSAADACSPTARCCARLGIGVRIGDPALPLLRPDAHLDARARELLQFDEIKNLPDALADADSPNARNWLLQRGLPALGLSVAVGLVAVRYSSSSRRSTPVSRTARRFLR